MWWQHLLFLSLAPLLTGIQAQQAGEQLVTVRTGQELADAVAAWGASGGNTTIQIGVPFISVRNATFQTFESIAARTGTEPFSSGRLTVRGLVNSDGKPATVLDAAMRAGLTPGLKNSATLTISNLIMMNLCEEQSQNLLTLQYSYPFGVSLFKASLAYSARTMDNLWLYGRQAAVHLLAYYIMVQTLAMPEVHNSVMSVLGVSGLVGQISDELTPYSAGVQRLVNIDTNVINVTIKAVENPDDPLLAQWKAQGILMPPQMCSGGPVVDAATQRLTAPIWISLQQSTFASKLEQAAAFTATPRLLNAWPVILAMTGEPVTAPDTGSYTVSGRLLLINNQLGCLAAWDMLYNVNLSHRVNLFNIAPGADVIIQWLGLTGLAVQVPTRLPPSLAGRSPDSLLPSVFPLAAFNTSAGPDTWNSTAQVKLINVTLAIPPDEYMALFILTSKQGKAGAPSCTDPTIIQRVDQLQAGISTWADSSAQDTSLEQHLQQQNPQLFLKSFVGWGLNADALRLVPTSPLVMPYCPITQQSGVLRSQVVGLAVGLACGVAVLLLAVWLVLARFAKQRRHATLSSAGVSLTTKSASRQQITEHNPPDTNALPFCASTVEQATTWRQHASLQQFVQQAQASQAQLFASLVGSPVVLAVPGTSGAAEQGVNQQQLHGQVAELAAKLQQEGDQLVLAGVLGSGSAGTVYMGLWRGLPVAVKTVIFHDASDSAGAKSNERVILEAAICASLGHKNVVATYHYDIKALVANHSNADEGGLQIDMASTTEHVDQHAYKLFLVHELCNAALSIAIDDELFLHATTRVLNLRAVLSVMLDIASGLEYLHSKGIIHGDMKPDNVLLKVDTDTVEGVIAKLADFGLSTKLPPGRTHVSNYRSGTPFYVAPEVTANHQMSTASDMYSFGVICWELFMQERPYSSEGGLYAWRPYFASYPACKRAPAEFVQLSDRCLQHDPQKRPTASEAVSILADLLASHFE